MDTKKSPAKAELKVSLFDRLIYYLKVIQYQ